MFTLAGKVLSIKYDVRSVVSDSLSVVYGVKVPVASSKTFSLVYKVKSSLTSNSVLIQYNTGIVGSTSVSKTVQVLYHTLVKPTVGKVITKTTEVDAVPPQIVTTTSF